MSRFVFVLQITLNEAAESDSLNGLLGLICADRLSLAFTPFYFSLQKSETFSSDVGGDRFFTDDKDPAAGDRPLIPHVRNIVHFFT